MASRRFIDEFNEQLEEMCNATYTERTAALQDFIDTQISPALRPRLLELIESWAGSVCCQESLRHIKQDNEIRKLSTFPH